MQAVNKFINKASLKSGLHVQHQYLFKNIIVKQYGLNKTDYLEPIIYLLYVRHFKPNCDISKLKEAITNYLPRSFHVASKFYEKLPVLDS